MKLLLCIAITLQIAGYARADSNLDKLRSLDLNEDGRLSEWEIKAGVQFYMHSLSEKEPAVNLRALHKKLKGKDAPKAGDIGPVHTNATDAGYALFKAIYGEEPSNGYLISTNIDYRNIVMSSAAGEWLPITENTNSLYLWKKPGWGDLKIRRTVDQLKKSDTADSVQGALASYAHTFSSEKDAWLLHGVVAFPFSLARNPLYGKRENVDTTGLDSLTITPSISFDKVDSQTNPKDNVNALVYRVGVGALFTNPTNLQNWCQGEYLESRFTYASDFSNARKVVGGEFDISPIRNGKLSVNSSLKAFPWINQADPAQANERPWFKYHVKLNVHCEGGTVIDADNDPKLLSNKDYFRAGPLIGIRIVPAAYPELAFSANYRKYFNTFHSGGNVELFDASAEWQIIKENDHILLTVAYQNGTTPILMQRDNSVTIGLGFKY